MKLTNTDYKNNRVEIEKKLYEYQGEDRMVSSLEIAEQLKATEDTVSIYPTYMTELDRLLEGGIEGGELAIVTGGPSAGKTTFLMSITQDMAKHFNTAWFTMEVTPRQFMKKLGENPPLFYTPNENKNGSVEWLIERMIEAIVKYNTKVFFIDHLHFFFSLSRFSGKSLSLELGDVVTKIKQLAVDYNVAVFLIAHSTDDKASNREPRMTDVRDSGMVIRLADIVLGVWRVNNTTNWDRMYLEELDEDAVKSKVKLWKNRRVGKTGKFFTYYDQKDRRLYELDEKNMPAIFSTFADETKMKKNYEQFKRKK